MEHGSRTRLVTALILVAVFGSGILIGVAFDGSLGAQPVESVANDTEEKTSSRRRTPMYEQVGPDDEQSTLIATIIQDHRARMDALHDEFREAYDPRYQSIIHDTREAIVGVLTPEQATEYRVILDEWDRNRAEREEKGDESR